MIKITGLHKNFDGKIAIKDASCSFGKHQITVILGPSGSGKTTLIRCINLLEKPDKGEIFLSKEKISEKNISSVRKKVGMVFQSFNLFHHMNVLENLVFAPIHVNKMDRKQAENKAINLLKQLNIEDKKNNLPSKLSGGQKQRVAIARALMMDPEVVMFDEPTSALDPESVKDIARIIEDIKKTHTVIIVTHHITFAKKIADQVIFMDKGMILANQKASEFFEAPQSIRAKLYLETVGEY